MGLHALVFTVLLVPFPTWVSLLLCIGFYCIRMFGLTAGYHRGLAHKSYETSRWFQFCIDWWGCAAMQKGPLWWAEQHRRHHRYSDQEGDPHSPVVSTTSFFAKLRGFFWAQMGWVLADKNDKNLSRVQDLAKFPELRMLNRFHWMPGLCLIPICYAIDGWSGVVYGFVVSTVVLYHGTFSVNSFCHIFGTRRFNTKDQSRNNWWVAIFTLGEGWHNNHHHQQRSARQGFMWWEYDISYYVLWLLSKLGLVWNLHQPRLETIEDETKEDLIMTG